MSKKDEMKNRRKRLRKKRKTEAEEIVEDDDRKRDHLQTKLWRDHNLKGVRVIAGKPMLDIIERTKKDEDHDH